MLHIYTRSYDLDRAQVAQKELQSTADVHDAMGKAPLPNQPAPHAHTLTHTHTSEVLEPIDSRNPFSRHSLSDADEHSDHVDQDNDDENDDENDDFFDGEHTEFEWQIHGGGGALSVPQDVRGETRASALGVLGTHTAPESSQVDILQSLHMCTCIYMHIHMFVYTYVCIYIYTYIYMKADRCSIEYF